MRKVSPLRPTPEKGRQQEGQRRRYPHNNFERRNYSLLNNVENETSDAESEILLRGLAQELFLEKEVQPGDTLQTLALQFNCPVAELKRLNNIHRDNEICARRVVKVPVKPISLLTRKLPEVHLNLSCKENVLKEHTLSEQKCSKDKGISITLISNTEGTELTKPNGNTLTASTSENACQCQTDEDSDVDLEDNSAKPLLSNQDLESAGVNSLSESHSPYSCSGADWGLSWSQLLIFSLLLGFAGPILYALYKAEKAKTHKQQ